MKCVSTRKKAEMLESQILILGKRPNAAVFISNNLGNNELPYCKRFPFKWSKIAF
jgi:hypothetical protein